METPLPQFRDPAFPQPPPPPRRPLPGYPEPGFDALRNHILDRNDPHHSRMSPEQAAKIEAAYVRPYGGIPGTDLSDAVRDALRLASASLQPADVAAPDPAAPETAVASAKAAGEAFAAIAEKYGKALRYKGSKATASGLPSSGNEAGDMWNVLDTGRNYAWDGEAWDDLGGTVDLSAYLPKSDVVAPSTSASAGKAADAKATGDALANKVPRNGDTGLTGNYGTTGSIGSTGARFSGHMSPTYAGMDGNYGDLTVASLEEDPTHAVPPESLKLWMANIYADRIERFDGDTGQGAVTHRFPAGDGTLALASQIPSVTGKADKVTGATAGNFAGLDAGGNLTDSGKKAADFATPSDIPAVVAPSTAASDAGKAADAKATGDALAHRVPATFDAGTETWLIEDGVGVGLAQIQFADIEHLRGGNGTGQGLSIPAPAVAGDSVARASDLPAAETWTFEVDDGQGGTTTVMKRVAVYPAQQQQQGA